jgi:hypothetical protein
VRVPPTAGWISQSIRVAAILVPCSFPCSLPASLLAGRYCGPRLRSNVPPAARPRKVQETRSPLPPRVGCAGRTANERTRWAGTYRSCARRASNLWPLPCQGSALPASPPLTEPKIVQSQPLTQCTIFWRATQFPRFRCHAVTGV